MGRCIAPLLLLAFMPAAAAAQEWTGRWVLRESRPDGVETRTGVLLETREGAVAGKYRSVPAGNALKVKDGDELFRGKPGGPWTITLRAIGKEGAIATTDAELKLEKVEGKGEFAGDYLYKKYRESDGSWQEDGRIPIRLVPACRPIVGPIRLGTGDFKLEITLKNPLEPIHDAEDPAPEPGFCHYAGDGVASLSLPLESLGDLKIAPPAIRGLDLQFYFKEGADPEDPKAYQDVQLGWSDDETGAVVLFSRWNTEFVLYSVGITLQVTQTGGLLVAEGSVEVQMNAAGDLKVAGPLYLGGDLNGIIRYDWNPNAKSWTSGGWSFDGFGSIVAEVRRSGAEPLVRASVDLRAEGEAVAEFQLAGETSIAAGGAELTLERTTLRGVLSLATGEARLVDGSIAGKIRFASMPHPFSFEIVYDGAFRLKISSGGPFKLFGGTCSTLDFETLLDESLELKEFSAAFDWKHDKLARAIRIREFSIVDGALKTFEGSGSAGLGGFNLDIARIRYDATASPARLQLQATLGLDLGAASASVAVRDLVITAADGDLSRGEISEFDVAASLRRSPLVLELQARMKADEISGSFNGELGSILRIAGSVVLGSFGATPAAAYSYGYFTLDVEIPGAGIPLGQTGLKLIGIGGGIGLNYIPPGMPGTPDRAGPGGGGPKRGTHYVAGSLTLGDVAGLMRLKGKIELQVGRDNSVRIEGIVQVTQRTSYFRGNLAVSYVFGSGEIQGEIGSTVTLPTDGSVVYVENNTLRFGLGRGRWFMSGSRLGGKLFQVLELSRGTIDLGGTLEDPAGSFAGSVGGRLSGRVRKGVRFDAGIADVEGSLSIELLGEASARLGPGGLEGAVILEASFHGTVYASNRFGTREVEVDATASVTVTQSPKGMNVKGNVEIFSVGFSFDYDL